MSIIYCGNILFKRLPEKDTVRLCAQPGNRKGHPCTETSRFEPFYSRFVYFSLFCAGMYCRSKKKVYIWQNIK
jgi:hypothetical protein